MKRILMVCSLVVLVFLVVGCEESVSYEQEPNDIREQATVLLRKIGNGAISSDSDEDYWVVTVPDDGETHSFRIKNLTGNLQLMLYAYDTENSMIDASAAYETSMHENPLRSDNPDLWSEEIHITVRDRLVLYLLVQVQADGGSSGSYTIEHVIID